MKKLTLTTRIVLFVCGLAFFPALKVPVWQIILEAPQYPEGLKMEIWANKFGGDVKNINNLNHYIGMDTITEDKFPELKVMPYMILAMGILAIISSFTGQIRLLWITAIYLIVCGTWGMIDFYQWEYDYGHNLDPHAAIKIPGMSYQPPLIGWKQLLNFLACSMPDTGGWLIISSGTVICGTLFLEIMAQRTKKGLESRLLQA